jgi:hypothetical protein
MTRRAVGFWFGYAPLVACGTVLEPSAGPDAGEDSPASAVDADIAPDSSDAADVGSPFYVDDKFEVTQATCPGWAVLGATAEVVAGGRSGNACRICTTQASGRLTKSFDETTPGTYTATMYVKRDSTTPDGGKWGLGADWTFATGTNTSAYAQGALTDTWVLAQSTAPNAMPTTRVMIRLTSLPGVGECYLVDDVQFRRE